MTKGIEHGTHNMGHGTGGREHGTQGMGHGAQGGHADEGDDGDRRTGGQGEIKNQAKRHGL